MFHSSLYRLIVVVICGVMLLTACAPAPTAAPTAVPVPTLPPTAPPTMAPTAAPTVAPTTPPTAVPTAAPPKPTVGPGTAAPALAAKKQTTELLVDSFEKGKVGEFADGWVILDNLTHTAQKSGARVAELAPKLADNKLAIKMISNPDVDGKMNRDFPAVPQGRLYFYGMVPTTDAGFLSVELRAGAKRLFNLEMHQEGRFRYRDDGGNLQESKVNFKFDQWYQLMMEWDTDYNLWQGYLVEEGGKLTPLTPIGGVPFSKEAPGTAPTRIEVRLNRATALKVGYVDLFKLFKIE